MRISTALTAIAGIVLVLASGQAQELRIERGRMLAETRCARCHAIGLSGNSPRSAAPPFRILPPNLAPEDLGAVFSDQDHEIMPKFQEMGGSEVVDLATYMRSLAVMPR